MLFQKRALIPWLKYDKLISQDGSNESFLENNDTITERIPSHLTKRSTIRSIMFTISLILSFALGAIVALYSMNMQPNRGRFGLVPDFSTQIRTITHQTEFLDPPSLASDAHWKSVVPYGSFVLIPNAIDYGLPSGLPTPHNGTTAYGLTWTHEYHCLMLVRKSFWDLVRGTSEFVHNEGEEDTLDPQVRRELGHVSHCIDYVRQLVVCSADMTIEIPATYPAADGNPYHIDGYGTSHQCKNYNEVMEYMAANSPP